jgi:hypothetical protein
VYLINAILFAILAFTSDSRSMAFLYAIAAATNAVLWVFERFLSMIRERYGSKPVWDKGQRRWRFARSS